MWRINFFITDTFTNSFPKLGYEKQNTAKIIGEMKT